jgi:DNA repair protein RecO (recombination protein O)
MIESTRGLILRTRPLTETSLIVNWLTPDLGRLATVAKAARRPRSPFAGKLDLFFEADFSFHRSLRSELHTLRELSLLETHAALRSDLAYFRQASYAVALLEQTTETETPLPAVHELMLDFLSHLVRQPPHRRSVYAFELKLLHQLGLRPDLVKSRLSPATQDLMTTLIEADWSTIAGLEVNATQARELRQFMHGFLIYHLGKIPQGRGEVFASR